RVKEQFPGTTILECLIVKKRGCGQGRVVEFLKFSNDRVEPPCIHFYDCGGCKWQNLDYVKQIGLKDKAVRDAMRRIGDIEVEHYYPIIGCTEIYEYRNKLEFTFSDQRWLTEAEMTDQDKDIRLQGLGFHRPGRFDKVLD